MVIQEFGKTSITYNKKDYEITIYILDGIFYISFYIGNEKYQIKMYPADKNITFYIEDLAQWTAYDYIAKHELDLIMEKVSAAIM